MPQTFRRLSSRSPGLTLVSLLLIPALLHQALLLPRPFTLMLLLPRSSLFLPLAPAASALSLCLVARLAASLVLRLFAAAAVAPPSALLQFTLRTSLWAPARPDCSARSRLVRITLTLLKGGSPSKRCGPT